MTAAHRATLPPARKLFIAAYGGGDTRNTRVRLNGEGSESVLEKDMAEMRHAQCV